MELIVEGKGVFLGKHQGRLRVTRDKKVLSEVALINIKQVVIVSTGVGISSDVIRTCSEEGIPIHFITSRGEPTASLYSAGLTGTVMTRRAQLLAYEDKRGVLAVKAFIAGKLENQANLLRYLAKNRKETDPAVHEQLTLAATEMRDFLHELEQLNAEKIETIRGQVFSIEGRAAQRYWDQIKQIIPEHLQWPGRETQGATDPFNSALNYGYGILYHQIEQALVLAGLDPYAGFLHTDRSGKPSLVCDCVEEFRQAIVDRTIIGLVNRNVAIGQDDQHRLSEETRKKLSEKINERLEGTESYEKKKQTLRCIIQSQARHLALFLRNERERYEPFIAGW